jgi:RNA 3'-terminal phosphate cyclase
VCITTFGSHNLSAEKVGKAAVKAMNNYLNSGNLVGRNLAGQLILPMAPTVQGNSTP